MIELTKEDLKIVKDILKKHIPDREVWVIGSRVTGKVKSYSDLDLVILGDKALTLNEDGNLREDFQNSDLPFRVDIIDWNTTSESFKKIILEKYETL